MSKNMSLIKKLQSGLQISVNILIITFVLLLLVEYSLSFMGRADQNSKVDDRSKLSVYDNQWGAEFWQEYRLKAISPFICGQLIQPIQSI